MNPQGQTTITIPVEEYIHLRQNIGHRYAVIDEGTRATITSQEGWENDVFIQEIPSSPVFKLWRLKDWLHHRENDMELVKENQAVEDKKARERHLTLERWKIEARKKLREKTNLAPEAIERHIRGCVNPPDVVKRTDGEGEDEYLNRLGFFHKLRAKLGYPFSGE